MARQGISYEQVADAAQALVAEQLKPTLSAVRERLGSGSMNTIHRHLSTWQGQQKPAVRKLGEVNPRVLAALGSEISRAADDAAADAEAALAQAMAENAVLASTGEALEAERDALTRELQQVATERDKLAGKAAEQAAEIDRLNAEAERERAELAAVRRALAQVELRLEAVPHLERDLGELRMQLAAEQAARVAADRAAAVAEAQRDAADTARMQADERLASAESREHQVRVQLAEAQTAHERTREKLTEVVGFEAGARAELRLLREHIEATKPVPASATDPQTSQTPSKAATRSKP
ncbi:DNA-binding protein [Ralstonia solanacearum]|uniref:DNA-binding protein n=1 Tax=Ralstonia solanacearum TaxID=305 RepID=UPI0005ABE845|nr:DNA-binding protein [Ralstonia solanacearum]MBB6592706.1 DNA-binding protein [Ralstonia solanacearum]MBB6596928.1 DNA-binding protein [Ralstonia solanacearum]MDB0541172.1 DNA-binding protein [Ralstonia solanacearum]MDB0551454.1 DNA-binding protein [Ralstonia solanacearum]MDB0556121.1 DNA-binding protein [Ralstonia solanacearum]